MTVHTYSVMIEEVNEVNVYYLYDRIDVGHEYGLASYILCQRRRRWQQAAAECEY